MTNLTILCACGYGDSATFEVCGNRVALELSMQSEDEEPLVMLNKKDVAKLIEFLNGLELAE
jgi:hypothetical protein